MKTLADLRRRLQPGDLLKCLEHTRNPQHVGTVRCILKVQQDSVLTADAATRARRYLMFPRAKDLVWLTDHVFQFNEGRRSDGALDYVRFRILAPGEQAPTLTADEWALLFVALRRHLVARIDGELSTQAEEQAISVLLDKIGHNGENMYRL
jgi:hypothetical protein